MTEDTIEPDLTESRSTIDALDRDLIGLLKRRIDVARDVGEWKRENSDSAIVDSDREQEVFASWAAEATRQGVSSYYSGRVLREILNFSRRHQERVIAPAQASATHLRIGYQGEEASYSDLAITRLFADREDMHISRTGYSTFAAVLHALESGNIDRALLPVENSTSGSIGEVNHMLVNRPISIVAEEFQAVEHCLAAPADATLEGLREVHSHPVALQQCRDQLDALPHVHAHDFFDTAGAAQWVKKTGDPRIAAICSEAAAELYGLTILERHVGDVLHNQTRFLLLAREAESPDRRQPTKTTLTFTVDNECGALVQCLHVFTEHRVNMTRLESRPQVDAPWSYSFLIDLDGHRDDDAISVSIRDLSNVASHVRVLGSYAARGLEHRPVPPAGPSECHMRVSSGELPARELPTAGTRRPALEVAPSPRRIVRVGSHGRGVPIGGDQFTLLLGPCAVESEAQIQESAALVKAHGAHILRGGAFKPRSSPHSFQGLGFVGLDYLADAGQAYELPIVTEVLRTEDVQSIAARADLLQVGARNMQNFELLKELGKLRRPVLLKRGMSATLRELLQAAEYIKAGGNMQVVLCERGIRTFETATRATLDLSAIPVLRTMTDLPIIVDPSHAAGQRHLVVPLALAAAAVGADGIIVECHPDPESALCDKDQALTADDVEEMVTKLRPIVAAQGRHL